MLFLQAAATRSDGGIDTAMKHYARMCDYVGVRAGSLHLGGGDRASESARSPQTAIRFKSVTELRIASLTPTISRIGRRLRTLMGGDATVILLHSDLLLGPLRRIAPKAIIVSICHSSQFKRKKNADLIITLNGEQQELVSRTVVRSPARVRLLGNPFVRDEQSTTTPTAASAGPIGKIVFCARLAPQKNPANLLRAYAMLPADRPPLVIFGDGPLLRDLQALAKELSVSVHFPGWMRDPWSQIDPTDLLVMPSLWEGLPYLAQEALSRGIPVIASNIAGHRAALAEGELGVLYQENDDRALADALSDAIRTPIRTREMSVSAQTHIDRHYGAEAFYGNLMEFLKPLLQRRTATHENARISV